MTEGVNATVEVEIRLLEGMLGRDVVVRVFTANASALCKLEWGRFGVLTLIYYTVHLANFFPEILSSLANKIRSRI